MPPPPTPRSVLLAACVLALGAAVSLGLARFSYALLLPPMRADLGWDYLTAGAMNTANAGGYLIGALAMPWALRRWGGARALLAGGAAVALLLAAHGLTRSDTLLYALRALTGVGSAAMFVSGGLLAARLGTRAAELPTANGQTAISPGLVLGLYYGGTGLGITACAALLPPLIAHAGPAASGVSGVSGAMPTPASLGWPAAWLALGLLAAVATLMLRRVRDAAPLPAAQPAPAPAAGQAAPVAIWRPFAAGLAGYTCFGLGYIGYMTFIVTLLREQHMGDGVIAAFYALLGLGVMASPWLWAGLLQHHRSGRPLATLNALLAIATLLPVLPGIGAHSITVFASGALFGAVFLSVVASTTALVRHNLPPEHWPAGITAFTVVFAGGQIIGPTLVGWLSDGAGGLRAGLAVSAAALAIGAVVATGQRALPVR